jgi:hypothetical protein
MYSITDENIDFILHDLMARGIETESLRLNLLDHICILIEQNLEENGDFLMRILSNSIWGLPRAVDITQRCTGIIASKGSYHLFM